MNAPFLSAHAYPLSMRPLTTIVRTKAIEIANALLGEGFDTERAERVALVKTKEWAAARGLSLFDDGQVGNLTPEPSKEAKRASRSASGAIARPATIGEYLNDRDGTQRRYDIGVVAEATAE